MAPRTPAKKAPAKSKKATAKRPAAKPESHRRQRVRVYRNTADGKWYAERRAANGTLMHRTHGYAKKSRAEEYGRKLAEAAEFVLEEPLDL